VNFLKQVAAIARISATFIENHPLRNEGSDRLRTPEDAVSYPEVRDIQPQ